MSKRGNILLVDDDPSLLRLLALRMEGAGHRVETAASASAALAVLARWRADLVITDLRMDGMDGIGLLEEIGRRRPGLPVIVLTAHGTIPDAVSATRLGALDFLTKPVDKEQLFRHIQSVLVGGGNEDEPQASWASRIITRSPAMHDLLAQARLVAEADAAVLIRGDSGTGKEVLARAIHDASPRRHAAFVAINCGAMPENLLESELFGHEKGAFTDAKQARPGLLREAQGGTVLLDEIGDMPLPLQVKLLRVLQEAEVRPVGSARTVAIDVRVLSATHRDLGAAIAAQTFREDLYYRLNVVSLALPALHERREDIPLLANHFLQTIAERRDQPAKVYAPEAMELLAAAPWPGNIRQLANMVEQNVALTRARVIPMEQVRKGLAHGATEDARTPALPSLHEARESFTRDYLSRLLHITEGNVSRSARLAKRNRTEFYKLLARHGVNPGDYKTVDCR